MGYTMSMFSCPIVTVKSVEPNPNADRLDILTFEEMAWVCQDVRGKRKVGDVVVYIPVDAMVDCTRPEFEFLAKNAKMRPVKKRSVSNDVAVGTDMVVELRPIARIKTIKLKNVISQGLVIDLPEGFPVIVEVNPAKIAWYASTGETLTSAVPAEFDMAFYFGVTKYEPPAEAVFSANAKGGFIDWCPRTDAERYQNVNRTVEPYIDDLYAVSVKVDGTSLTVFYDGLRTGDERGVCSRNQELKPPWDASTVAEGVMKFGFAMDAYWKAAVEYNLLDKAQALCLSHGFDRVAFQCELAGEGIQSNNLGLKGVKPFLFDIYVMKSGCGWYLPYSEMLQIAEGLQIETVPMLFKSIRLSDIAGNPPDFSFMFAMTYALSGHLIEGLVFVGLTDVQVGRLGRLKFKYINPHYLLSKKEDE